MTAPLLVVVSRQQAPPFVAEPPQQPDDGDAGGSALLFRMAARDLQKSVLLGSARHWEQVHGPLLQDAEAAVVDWSGGRTSWVFRERGGRVTSVSEGGGVNCGRRGGTRPGLLLPDEAARERSAQMQGVPS